MKDSVSCLGSAVSAIPQTKEPNRGAAEPPLMSSRAVSYTHLKLLSRQKIAENNGRTVEIRYAPALDSYKGLTFDELESSDTDVYKRQ